MNTRERTDEEKRVGRLIIVFAIGAILYFLVGVFYGAQGMVTMKGGEAENNYCKTIVDIRDCRL